MRERIKEKGIISLKVQIILFVIAGAVLVLAGLGVTGWILYQRGYLFSSGNGFGSRDLTVKEKSVESNEETEERIKELEDKIKELEDNQQVPFPPDEYFLPPLTEEQISAVVELWCPDDNYNYNGFVSIGSGSIVHPEGIILTNRHVVSNEDWSVIMSSPTCYVGITDNIAYPPEPKYMADLVAYSPQNNDYFDFDVAVLYIYDVCYECEGAPKSLPASFSYLDLGYSDVLAPGDYVAIAGYPAIGADTFNFTDGIISGRVGEFVLKTDAKIDSGNSGGAALNSQNQLIGIPTWTISGQAESMGYVVAIDQILNWYEQKVVPSESLEVPY